jgi:hypothetical protein
MGNKNSCIFPEKNMCYFVEANIEYCEIYVIKKLSMVDRIIDSFLHGEHIVTSNDLIMLNFNDNVSNTDDEYYDDEYDTIETTNMTNTTNMTGVTDIINVIDTHNVTNINNITNNYGKKQNNTIVLSEYMNVTSHITAKYNLNNEDTFCPDCICRIVPSNVNGERNNDSNRTNQRRTNQHRTNQHRTNLVLTYNPLFFDKNKKMHILDLSIFENYLTLHFTKIDQSRYNATYCKMYETSQYIKFVIAYDTTELSKNDILAISKKIFIDTLNVSDI